MITELKYYNTSLQKAYKTRTCKYNKITYENRSELEKVNERTEKAYVKSNSKSNKCLKLIQC